MSQSSRNVFTCIIEVKLKSCPCCYLDWALSAVPVVRGGPAEWICSCETGVWTATRGRWALLSAGLWFPFAARIRGLLAHLHRPAEETHKHSPWDQKRTLTHNVASLCFVPRWKSLQLNRLNLVGQQCPLVCCRQITRLDSSSSIRWL